MCKYTGALYGALKWGAVAKELVQVHQYPVRGLVFKWRLPMWKTVQQVIQYPVRNFGVLVAWHYRWRYGGRGGKLTSLIISRSQNYSM